MRQKCIYNVGMKHNRRRDVINMDHRVIGIELYCDRNKIWASVIMATISEVALPAGYVSPHKNVIMRASVSMFVVLWSKQGFLIISTRSKLMR